MSENTQSILEVLLIIGAGAVIVLLVVAAFIGVVWLLGRAIDALPADSNHQSRNIPEQTWHSVTVNQPAGMKSEDIAEITKRVLRDSR